MSVGTTHLKGVSCLPPEKVESERGPARVKRGLWERTSLSSDLLLLICLHNLILGCTSMTATAHKAGSARQTPAA